MSDKNGRPSGKCTLVEEGTEFKGAMSSSCPIVVMGKVEGDVTGPMIEVTESGTIAGNVKVKELRSAGEVAGEVHAETVTISGRIRDRTIIRARTLQVSLDSGKGMQVVFGECELAVGDEPNKEAAIAAASAGASTPREPAPQDAGWSEAPSEPPKSDGKRVKGDDDGEPRGRRRRGGTQPPPPA